MERECQQKGAEMEKNVLRIGGGVGWGMGDGRAETMKNERMAA
jgi:hypothetical protein